MFDSVSGSPEEMSPEGTMDELEEGKNSVWADRGTGWFAVEEEGQETQAQGIALFVESRGMWVSWGGCVLEGRVDVLYLRSRS